MNLTKLMFVVLPLSLTMACGQLSKEDAKKTWAKTQKALGGSGSGALTAESALNFSGEFTADCDQGGTAEFKSRGSVDEGEISSVNFDYDVTFTDCQEDETIINGTIVWSANVETGDLTATKVTVDYAGDLIYTGDVNGTCNTDMNVTVETGVAGSDVSITGSYCGYEGQEFEDIDIAVSN